MSPACRGTQVVGVTSAFFADWAPGFQARARPRLSVSLSQTRSMGEAGHSRWDLGEGVGTGCNPGAQHEEALIIKADQE